MRLTSLIAGLAQIALAVEKPAGDYIYAGLDPVELKNGDDLVVKSEFLAMTYAKSLTNYDGGYGYASASYMGSNYSLKTDGTALTTYSCFKLIEGGALSSVACGAVKYSRESGRDLISSLLVYTEEKDAPLTIPED